jgi:hypothetical protein
MRCSARLIAILWALSATTALAQTTAAPSAGARMGQPGVDVWSTLYPRTPPATVTHPYTLGPAQLGEMPQQAVGIPAGSIILYPSLTGGAFYDDNVFARTTNRASDWAYFVRPEIAFRSNNWQNAELAGAAFVEKRWYDTFNSEDQVNGGAALGGTVQPNADTQLVGRVQYLHAHEDRGASDTIFANFARPVAYDQVEAAGAINRRYGRMWTSFGAAGAWIHYDTPTLAGLPVSQAYRNGEIYRVPGRIGYVVAPLTSVFVEVSGHWRDFEVNSFDSSGYRVVAGMLFEPGPGSRVKGEFFGGYMNQDYSGFGFKTVSTWTYGASMAFLLAQNWTAVIEGRRDAKEASLSGGLMPGDGVSVIETLAAGRLDWTVAPNFVVGAGVSYLVDEYLLASRTDRSWSPLFSAKYFVNRNFTLGFDYRHLKFESSGMLVPEYYRNVYLLSANFRI